PRAGRAGVAARRGAAASGRRRKAGRDQLSQRRGPAREAGLPRRRGAGTARRADEEARHALRGRDRPKPARPLRQAPRGAADAGSRLRRKECAGAPTTTTHGVGMTREAKIGLLVALAFLLVIGILLSD